jgi:hypothetical protein
VLRDTYSLMAGPGIGMDLESFELTAGTRSSFSCGVLRAMGSIEH